MTTEITFIIPIWTAEEERGLRYLGKAIDSLVNQTIPNWRLVVVDDKSPIRGMEEFVKGYKDSRIEYYANERNLGQSGNWNKGVQLVKTPFYTILHADDELKSNYIEVMLPAIKSRTDVAALFCNAEIIDEHGNLIRSFVDYVKTFFRKAGSFDVCGDQGLDSLLKGNFIMCPTVIYRKALTDGLLFSEEWKYIPDLYYWSHLLLNERKLFGIPDVTYRYRRHSQSVTGTMTKTTKMFDEESRFYDFVRERAAGKNWALSVARAEKKQIVKLRTIYFTLIDLLGLRIDAAGEKMKFLGNLF